MEQMKEEDCKAIIVSGRRGSGKTYWATRQIIDYAQKGFPVWTNVALDASAAIWRQPHSPVYKCTDITEVEHMANGLFVFDEAALLGLNSRQWKDLSPRVLTILANARKVGMRIIIICQAVARLDVIARELADEYLRFEKGFLGVRFTGHRGVLDPIKNQVVEYEEKEYIDEEGNLKLERKPLSKDAIWLLPRFAKAYDTRRTYDLDPKAWKWETMVAGVLKKVGRRGWRPKVTPSL